MEYNKRQFTKSDDKKVLHKVKKHWVILSLSMLALLGSSLVTVHVTAHADTNNQEQSTLGNITNTLRNRINAQLTRNNRTNRLVGPSKNRSQMGSADVKNQADVLHNRILRNANFSHSFNSILNNKDNEKTVDNSNASNRIQKSDLYVKMPKVGATNSGTYQGMNYTYDTNSKALTFTGGTANSGLNGFYAAAPSDVKNAHSITFGPNVNTSNVQYMGTMFQNDQNLELIDFGNFDTSRVTYLDSDFQNDANLKTVILSPNFDTSSTHSGNMYNFLANTPALTTLVIKSPKTKFYNVGSNGSKLPEMYHKETMSGYVSDNAKLVDLTDNQSHTGIWTTIDDKRPYTVGYIISGQYHNAANRQVNAKVVSDIRDHGTTQSDLQTLQNVGSIPAGYELDTRNLVNGIVGHQVNLNVVPIGLMINGTWGTTQWSLFKDGTLVLNGGSLESPDWPSEIPQNSVKRIKIINGVKAPQDTNKYDVDEQGQHSNSNYHNTKNPYLPGSTVHAANGNMPGLFGGLNQLQEIDVSGLDTSDTSDFSGMFNDDQQLLQVDGMSDNPHFNNFNKVNGGRGVDLGYMFDQDYKLRHVNFTKYFSNPHVNYFEDVFNGCNEINSVGGLNNINTADTITISNVFQGCYVLRQVDISTWDTRKAYTLDKENGSSNQNAVLFIDGNLSRIKLGPKTELAYDAVKNSSFYNNSDNDPNRLPNGPDSSSDKDKGFAMLNNPANGTEYKIYDHQGLPTGWYYYTNLVPVDFNYTEWLTSDNLPDDSYTDHLALNKEYYQRGLIKTYGQALAFNNMPSDGLNKVLSSVSNPENFHIYLVPQHVIQYGFIGHGKYLLYSDGEMDIYGTNGTKAGDVSEPILSALFNNYKTAGRVKSIVYNGGSINTDAIQGGLHASDLYQHLPNLTRISFGGINQIQGRHVSRMLANLPKLQEVDGIGHIGFSDQADASDLLASDPQLQMINGVNDWDLSKVKNASGMFRNDPVLSNLNLSDVKASDLSNVSQMFASDTGLNELNLNGLSFNNPNGVQMAGMFDKDNALSQLTLNQDTKLNGQGQDFGADFFSDNHNGQGTVTTSEIKSGIQPTDTYYYGNTVRVHYVDEFSGQSLGTGKSIPRNNLENSLENEANLPSGYYIDPMNLASDCRIYNPNTIPYINVNLVDNRIWTGYRWGQANVVINSINDTIYVNSRHTSKTTPLTGSLNGEMGQSIDNDMKKMSAKGSPLDSNTVNTILATMPNSNDDWTIKVESGTAPADSSQLFDGQGSNLASQITKIDVSGLDTSHITSTGKQSLVYRGSGIPQQTVDSGMFDDDSNLKTIVGLSDHPITITAGQQKFNPRNSGDLSSVTNGAFDMFAHDNSLTALDLSNVNTKNTINNMNDMFSGDQALANINLGQNSAVVLPSNTQLPYVWVPNANSNRPIFLDDGQVHNGDWLRSGFTDVLVSYRDIRTRTIVGRSTLLFDPHSSGSQTFSSQEIEQQKGFPDGYRTYPITQTNFSIDQDGSTIILVGPSQTSVQINFIDQNGKNVGKMKINNADVGGDIPLPTNDAQAYNDGLNSHYHLIPDQRSTYVVPYYNSSFNLYVTGNAEQVHSNVKVIYENSDGTTIDRPKPQQVPVTLYGYNGNYVTFNPTGIKAPSDYALDKQRTVNPDWAKLQDNNVIWVTGQNSSTQAGEPTVYMMYTKASLRLVYLNQNGQKVGCSDVIHGHAGQQVNVTDPSDGGSKVPTGYQLNGKYSYLNGKNSDNGLDGQDQDTVYRLRGGQHVVYLHVHGLPVPASVKVYRFLEDANGQTSTLSTVIHKLKKVINGSDVEIDPNASDLLPRGYSVDYSRDSTRFARISYDAKTRSYVTSPSRLVFYYRKNQTGGAPIILRYIDEDTGSQVDDPLILNGNLGQKVDATESMPRGINANDVAGENVPYGYSIDPNSSLMHFPASDMVNTDRNHPVYQFTDSPQAINIPVQGDQVTKTLYLRVIERDSLNQKTLYTSDVPVKISGRIGQHCEISPYGFSDGGIISSIQGLSHQYDAQAPVSGHALNFKIPDGSHATNSDADLPIWINENGQLSPLNHFQYTYVQNYQAPQIGTVKIHYIASDTLANQHNGDGKTYPVNGHQYAELDYESDRGTAGSPFDLTPYTNDLPEQLQSYYTSGDQPAMNVSGNTIQPSDYRWNFTNGTVDVYIKVSQTDNSGNSPIIIN